VDRALSGIPASPGIVIGPVHLLRWEPPDVPHRIIDDERIPAEVARLHDAIQRAIARLRAVAERVERQAGAEEAAIFEVQISILEDRELLNQMEA